MRVLRQHVRRNDGLFSPEVTAEAVGEVPSHPLHPEPYQGPPMREVEVPPRHYLMLGDHRGNLADSRVFGFVPWENLLPLR
jgi:hypothetical protein